LNKLMSFRTKLIFLIVFSLSFTTFAVGQGVVSTEGPQLLNQLNEDFMKAAEKSGAPQTNQVSRKPRNRGGWVVTAYVGRAHTASSALNISQPALGTNLTFEEISFQSKSFDPPLYYGFRGGYFIPRLPSLGIEAEFIHLKVFSNPQQRVRVSGLRHGASINRELLLGEIVQQYSISHGVNLLLFSVASRHGVKRNADAPDGRLILSGRIGIGPTLPHTESSVEGQRQEQYEMGRLGWQVAGGAEFKLWGRLYALGEYKFTRTRQRGKVFSGAAESLLRTHHGVFGLSYHF
jgi:hypothetical protein